MAQLGMNRAYSFSDWPAGTQPRACQSAFSAGGAKANAAPARTAKRKPMSVIARGRPEQVRENVKAAGVQLDAGLMRRIDEALGDAVGRDPSRTASPKSRP